MKTPFRLPRAKHLEDPTADAARVSRKLACPALPALTATAVALASAVLLTLAGCASSEGIATSATPITGSSLGLGTSTATATAPGDAVAADWWRGFGDTTLDALVERALAGSPSLQAAQARVVRAQAAVSGRQASDGVQVNGQADATRERLTANSIYPPPLGGAILNMADLQASASWEVDFFGRNRAAIAAAVGAQRAAEAEAQAARTLLASQVASTYVQLGRLFAQREVALRSLAQREQILGLIRQRVQGGLDTTVELRQGQGALPETRQQIEQLDEQIAITHHALAALTAQAPDALDGLTVPLSSVRAVALPARVPADLLGRRADITATRWRIEAADSDIRSARAEFYPNVNLTAFVGLSSIGLDKLLKSGSEQYGAGPALRLPIFDAGRLRANLRIKTADFDAAVDSYNAAVIDAVREVADQISSMRSIARQQTQQDEAQAAAESAYNLATQRYQAGLGTYLTVLNAEAGVLNQRRLGADLKARALDSQIALARALGGGYSADPALAQRNPAPGG